MKSLLDRPLWVQRTAFGIALALVLLSVLCVRVVISAKDELALAEQATAAKDRDAALVHYRRAARWYAPFNVYCERALDGLFRLASEAEVGRDAERELAAYRAVRSSILATRSFYTPHEEELERANRKIAVLMAKEPPPPMDADKSVEQLEKEHYALLTQEKRPRTGWTFLAILGFLTWVAAGFALASKAWNQDDKIDWALVRKWGGVIVLGFAVFVVGLLRA